MTDNEKRGSENAQERNEPDPPEGTNEPTIDGTGNAPTPENEPETFDREYVVKLRKEAGDYRIKAKRADELASKLLDATIEKATAGILADPTDLRGNLANESELLDDDGNPDSKKIEAAARELVKSKAHLGDRRPAGDVDQGANPEAEKKVSLAGLIRERM